MGIRRGKQEKSSAAADSIFPLPCGGYYLLPIAPAISLEIPGLWRRKILLRIKETLRRLGIFLLRICGNYICHQYLDGRRPHVDCKKNKKLFIDMPFRRLLYLSNFHCQ